MSTKVFLPRFPESPIPDNVSLPHCILQRARQHGNKVAYIDGVDGRRYTYADLVDRVTRVASGLHRRGVRKGDVVMLCTANCIEYPIILLGVTSIGAILTTANPLYITNELYGQMDDSQASYVIASQDVAGKMREAADRWGKIKARFVLGKAEGYQPFAEVMSDSAAYLPAVKIDPKQDTMLLPYSSGTTGKPKGVMLTHYNLVANIHQIANPGTSPDAHPGEETYICILPFYHIYGIAVLLLYGIFEGNTMIVFPKFELESYLKAAQENKATILHIVPPIAVLLSKHPLVDKFDLSSVHTAFCGAAPMGKELAVELMNRINIKNVRQGYGMSESSPGLLISPSRGWRHGSGGMLVPHTLCRIVHVETGKDLDVGEDGELWFKGPQVMKGYHRRPDATAETVDKDGWLHTGDIGHVDEDGHYFIVDRLKELIKFKGLQVAPADLESLLLSHPAIADAAVIGVPDIEAGELPRAFCVRKPDVKVTEGDIIKFVTDRVSPHKRLRGGVEFIPEIPKSAAGKILRRILKEKVKNAAKSKL